MFPYAIKIRCCPEKMSSKVGMSNRRRYLYDKLISVGCSCSTKVSQSCRVYFNEHSIFASIVISTQSVKIAKSIFQLPTTTLHQIASLSPPPFLHFLKHIIRILSPMRLLPFLLLLQSCHKFLLQISITIIIFISISYI